MGVAGVRGADDDELGLVDALQPTQLAGEVLDLYENDQRIQLTRRFDAHAPVLRADAGRLRQLLHNLLKNAIEAIGDARKPHIEMATRDVVENEQKWIELSVADNGVGIASEHLPRIFERFYRADPSRSREEGGTGLGLSIVKHLVEAHGGRVRAESEMGRGTRIVCVLPA